MDFNRFIDRHDLFNCESREPQAPAHSRFTQSCFIVHNTCVNNWTLFTDEKQRQTFVSSRVKLRSAENWRLEGNGAPGYHARIQ